MNNQERIFENNIIHITAQTAKIQIVVISKFLIANIIVSYIPNNTSMKLPEIHGNIIAQIAIDPHINVHHQVEVIESGVLVGAVIKKAITLIILKKLANMLFKLKSSVEIRKSNKKAGTIKAKGEPSTKIAILPAKINLLVLSGRSVEIDSG